MQQRKMKVSPIIVIKCVLLWVPMLLCLPMIFIVLSLLFIYKAGVIVLSKLLRREDIIRPVGGLDVFFSTDDFYRRPYGNVGFVWIIDGSVSPDVIMSRLQDALSPSTRGDGDYANDKNSESNTGYEKLTSVVPHFWLGYPFWRRARPFDIRNHVNIMESNPERFIQPDDINKMICEWMLEPFTQGRPLWEIRLMPNITVNSSKKLPDLLRPFSSKQRNHQHLHHRVDTPGEKEKADGDFEVKSILILKAHHILGDGYSMTGLLNKIIDTPNKPKSTDFGTPHKTSSLEKQQSCKKEVEKLIHQKHRKNQILPVSVSALSCKLLNAIQLTFLAPLTVLCMVQQIGIHSDYWFTQRKESEKLNWATFCISMERLSEIKKDLCSTLVETDASPSSHSTTHFYDNPTTRNNKLPIIVIVVSALAGALGKLLHTSSPAEAELAVKKFDKEKHSSKHYDMSDNYSASDRRQSIGRGISNDANSANFLIALPLPERHPGSTKFCNFWTHGILNVNMKETRSRRRLSLLNKYYWEMQEKRMPEIYHSLVQVFSLFPKPILKIMSGWNMGTSIGVTNLAGPTDCVFVGGQRVSYKYGYCGLLWRHASLTLASFSYNGTLTLSVLANESVVKDSASLEKLLSKYFVENLASLSSKTRGIDGYDENTLVSVIGPL